MVVLGKGSRNDRSTTIVVIVTIIWKLDLRAFMTLDVKWPLSYWNNSFTYALTLVKIFSILGAPKVVWISDTPIFFYKDEKPQDLECFFSGWPLAFEVHWYKDGKIITNGTEGIYYSEDRRRKYGMETVYSRLSLPLGREELEGSYKCRAKNKISGRQASDSLQYIYVCKQKPITT